MKRAVRAGSLLALLIVTASCGGGADTPSGGGDPVPGSITMTLAPSSGNVVAGASTNVAVTLSRVGSFAGAVTLVAEGAPSGVTVTAPIVAAGVNSATMNIAVSGAVAAGSYPITFRASGTGVTTVTAVYTLTVTAPPVQDYTLSMPAALSVEQGRSGTITVTIARSGGYTGAVSLTSSAPQDVQVNIAPNPVSQTSAVLTINVQSTAAAGNYPITVTGNDNGALQRTAQFTLTITPPPAAGTLTLSPAVVQVVQGSSTDIAVTLTRGQGVTGNATFVLENAPANVTGTFTPNNTSGATTTLKLDVGLQHPSGTVTVRVRATVGTATVFTDLQLTTSLFIPPDFSLSATPTALAVTAGSSGSSTIGITRSSSFTGAVNLNVAGAPAGVTATVTPSSAPGASATLNVSTTGATTAGVYPLTIAGTATGVTGTRTTTVSFTVNAPSGAGNVLWRFCSSSRAPIWFGTRTGTSGAWTQLTAGANTTYSVPFTQNGQVAYVHQSANGFDVTVLGLTPAEAVTTAASECTSSPGTKTVSGSVIGVDLPRLSVVLMGGSGTTTAVPPTGPFTLTGVADRLADLVAIRVFPGTGGLEAYDRFAIRRNINPANGATIAPLDLSGPESGFSNSSNMFFDGFGADPFLVTTSMTTANGLVGTYQFDLPSATSPREVRTPPLSLMQGGDLIQVLAATTNVTTPRQLIVYFSGTSSPGTKSFGPVLNAAAVSVLSNAPVRLRAQGTWQNEYGLSAGVTFTQSQSAPNARTVTITGSRAFLGDAGYTFDVPDFTGAAGWNAAWMLKPGVNTSHAVSAIGQLAGSSPTPADGVQLRTAQNIGSITP